MKYGPRPVKKVGLVAKIEPEQPVPAQRQAAGTECIPAIPTHEAPIRAVATRTCDAAPFEQDRQNRASTPSDSRLVDRAAKRGNSLEHPVANLVETTTLHWTQTVRGPRLLQSPELQRVLAVRVRSPSVISARPAMKPIRATA